MAGAGFLPDTDGALLAWSGNFSTLLLANYAEYGISLPQAQDYAALHAAFAEALAACQPSLRNKSAVIGKNEARAELKASARVLNRLIQAQPAVTDSQKVGLGLNVRAAPSPIPPPEAAPYVRVALAGAWTVRVKLREAGGSRPRAKPRGASGASIFRFAGPTAPADLEAWTFVGTTGRTTYDVNFPSTLAPGTRVWVIAMWFNGRKQCGPLSAPAAINLPGGGVTIGA